MNDSYYNSKFELCSSHAAIYSYSHDATMPILFSHYDHTSTLPPHSSMVSNNNWCTIFISLSSSFSLIIDDNLYTPSYGDIMIIREQQKYISFFPSSLRFDYYEINIPQEFFEKLKVQPFSDLFYSIAETNKNVIILDTNSFNNLMSNLLQIENTINSNSSIADILVYSYIIQILDILCTKFKNEAIPLPKTDKFPQKLVEALIYIHSNYTTISRIEEILDNCNVSNAYLAKIFKQYLFTSINQYITNLRISHAKYLLSQKESLTDACYKSGFNNYTYFISKFKSITGLSPSQFKK